MVGVTQYGVKIVSNRVPVLAADDVNRYLRKIVESGCEVVEIKHEVTAPPPGCHDDIMYTTFITYKTTDSMTEMPDITLY